MNGKGRLILVLSVFIIFVILFSQCMETEKQLTATDTTRAGAVTCKQCHAKIYDNYLKESHANTSWPVTTDEVVRGGNPKSNEFAFDEHLKIVVEKRKDGMYQVPYFDKDQGPAKRFDIAIGSGKNAHTYGFWTGDRLTQLQLTYFRSINEWTNSPGYPQRIYFQGMGIRCLECHTSDVKPTIGEYNFDKKSIVYGINCERCHGPAGKHVEFHIKNPGDTAAKYIKLYKDLTRKQKNDACAMCHSGNSLVSLKSAFDFKPGDTIESYYHYKPAYPGSEPDVHGNQLGMLQKSMCFNKSSMTCGTCHNPHKPEEENLIAYSKKCMSCHATVKHSEKTLGNAMVKTNCINCHMPLKGSQVITYQQAGLDSVSAYKLHTHRIAVY